MSFTTILETTDRTQLALAKLALQHADIPFKVLHEHTLNMGDAYVMGSTGAQIQVPFNEIGSARTLLKEQDLLQVGSSDAQFEIFKTLDKSTRSLPIIGRLDFSIRLVLLVFLMVAVPLVWYAVRES